MAAKKDTPLQHVRIYLSSGATIDVRCENIEWSYNNVSGAITEWTMTGVEGNRPRYIKCGDISAIVLIEE